jgi:hypothetical protein
VLVFPFDVNAVKRDDEKERRWGRRRDREMRYLVAKPALLHR